MWYKRPWVVKARNRLLVAALIALAGFLLYRHGVQAEGSISGYDGAKAQQYLDGLTWSGQPPQTERMTYGGAQWYKLAERGTGSLWLEPSAGQIAVRTAAGELWLSNPTQEALAADQTKGTWKTNLTSPLIVTYWDKDKRLSNTMNLADAKGAVAWRALPDGVGVRYTLTAIGVTVYLEYTLDDRGLSVHMPQEGVTESGSAQIVNLSVLPFFGAVAAGEDGYLFVPDGPGGLIEFDHRRADVTAPYDYPVYGRDEAIPEPGAVYNRTDIAYPVFGMKRGERGFIAVLEEGAASANIVAMPAGMRTGFHTVYPKFVWRQYYSQQKGLDANNRQNVYEDALSAQAFTIRYLFLGAGQSDYVGMAKRYRQYLTDERGASAGGAASADASAATDATAAKTAESGKPPLILDFMMAASEQPTLLGSKTIVVTTFDEVRQIVDDLYDSGVRRMQVSLRGWQHGGFSGSIPKRFPLADGLGGTDAFRTLQSDLTAKGIRLTLSDDLLIGNDGFGTGFSAKSGAAREITGKAMKFSQSYDFGNQSLYYYPISPQLILNRYLPAALTHWEQMGVGGIMQVDEYADGLYSDYNAGQYSSREQTAAAMNRMYDEIRGRVGWVGSSRAYAFSIGHVDLFTYFPLEYNYDLIVTEQVPFYPIALHGLIPYTSGPGNLRTDPQTALLREIEYGALPYYSLSAGDVRDLQRTTYAGFISGQYALVKQQLLTEYEQFAVAGADVWSQPIDGHRKLAEGVYETRYANRARVVVNYNETAYAGDGYKVEGRSFTAIKGGDGR